jgi:DNA-binding transcriptional LysR family regulator
MMREIQTLLVIMEEGSVNRAARRLGVAQPTLSRHIQALEQELGAPLFERSSRGMRATDLGFFMRDRFGPLVKDYELARAEGLAFAKGRRGQLRIGFIGSAAARFLNPALTRLRAENPGMKQFLFDQTPFEQLQALREGKIDVALIGQEAAALGDEFYQRKAATLKLCAILATDHPLAERPSIELADLKGERFIGVSEDAVPGRNAWITRLCAKVRFRPRFLAHTRSIAETFALVAGENAVALVPDYLSGPPPPGIALIPISDRHARWNLIVLRQRGAGSSEARRLFDLMTSGDHLKE